MAFNLQAWLKAHQQMILPVAGIGGVAAILYLTSKKKEGPPVQTALERILGGRSGMTTQTGAEIPRTPVITGHPGPLPRPGPLPINNYPPGPDPVEFGYPPGPDPVQFDPPGGGHHPGPQLPPPVGNMSDSIHTPSDAPPTRSEVLEMHKPYVRSWARATDSMSLGK